MRVLQRFNAMDGAESGSIEWDHSSLGAASSCDGEQRTAGSVPDCDQVLEKPGILLVEDDESICWLLSQVLATQHHYVLSARNAADGWRQWSRNRSSIRLLIMDIMMSGGPNGLLLAQAIQKENGSVPVIYTSVHSAVDDFGFLDAEINFLPKPFRMNDLLSLVSRVLAQNGCNAV